jgi:hypothetical protein
MLTFEQEDADFKATLDQCYKDYDDTYEANLAMFYDDEGPKCVCQTNPTPSFLDAGKIKLPYKCDYCRTMEENAKLDEQVAKEMK